jgi:hypothetical protein
MRMECRRTSDTDTAREVYVYRKMLAYYFTYMLGIHTELFGFKEFRVPILTTMLATM